MRAQSHSPKLRIRQAIRKLLSPLSDRYHIAPTRQVQYIRNRFIIDVRRRTRPLIPPRPAAELRTNRIQLDIFHRQPEVPLIHRAGIEPSLPKVAAPAMKTVDILRVAKVCPADGFGQRVLLVRDRDDMDMIAHQAIAGQLQRVLVRLLFQQLQIHPAIIVDEEHILAVVPTLRDMMGESNGYCPG